MFLVAKGITRYVQTAPERQLFDDLPVIENVDLYKMVDSVDFLERLAVVLHGDVIENQIYPVGTLDVEGERDVSGTGSGRFPDDLNDLAAYHPAQLDHLRRNQRAFEQLTDEGRHRVRELHDEVSSHPENEKLVAVMQRYFSWLQHLEPAQMRTVLDLPVDQRLETIRELNLQQMAELTGFLPLEDVDYVLAWLSRVLIREKQQVRQHLESDEFKHKLIEFLSENSDDFVRVADFELIGRVDPEYAGEILFKYIPDLRYGGLSSSGLNILEARDEQQQKELIVKWSIAATRAKRHVTDAQLKSFYRTLDDKTREMLDQKTPGEWNRELLKLYRQRLLRQRDFQLNRRDVLGDKLPEG